MGWANPPTRFGASFWSPSSFDNSTTYTQTTILCIVAYVFSLFVFVAQAVFALGSIEYLPITLFSGAFHLYTCSVLGFVLDDNRSSEAKQFLRQRLYTASQRAGVRSYELNADGGARDGHGNLIGVPSRRSRRSRYNASHTLPKFDDLFDLDDVVQATGASLTELTASEVAKYHSFLRLMRSIYMKKSSHEIMEDIFQAACLYYGDVKLGVVLSYFKRLDSILKRDSGVLDSTEVITATGASIVGDFANKLDDYQRLFSHVTGWHNAVITMATHIFALPLLGLDSLIEDSSFQHLIDKRVLSSLRSMPASQNFGEMIVVLKDFCHAIDAWLDPKDADSFSLNLASVQGWAQEIDNLAAKFDKRARIPGPGQISYEQFNKQFSELERKKTSYTTSSHSAWNVVVTNALRTLERIKVAKRTALHPDPSKPIVIALTGAPGLGKTELAKHIFRHLAKKKPEFAGLSTEILNSMLYTVQCGSKFSFETYDPERHYGTFMDEVGSIVFKDSPVQPFIMSIAEQGEHMTEQAVAERKGSIPFVSKILIICSNDPQFGLHANLEEHGIRERNAFYSRIDLHLHAEKLRPEYRRSDSRRGPRDDKPRTLDIAEWKEMTLGNQCRELKDNRILSFREVVSLIDETHTRVTKIQDRQYEIDSLELSDYVDKSDPVVEAVGASATEEFSTQFVVRFAQNNGVARTAYMATTACASVMKDRLIDKVYGSTFVMTTLTLVFGWSLCLGVGMFVGMVHGANMGVVIATCCAAICVEVAWDSNFDLCAFLSGLYTVSSVRLFTLRDAFLNFDSSLRKYTRFATYIGVVSMCCDAFLFVLTGGFSAVRLCCYFGILTRLYVVGELFNFAQRSSDSAVLVVRNKFDSFGISVSARKFAYVSTFCRVVSTVLGTFAVAYCGCGTFLMGMLEFKAATSFSVWCSACYAHFAWTTNFDPFEFLPWARVANAQIDAKLRSLGIDPKKVKIALSAFVTFLVVYGLTTYSETSPERYVRARERYAAEAAGFFTKRYTGDLPFQTPFIDVKATRSFWDNDRQGVVWPTSRKCAKDLIELIRQNQVRMAIKQPSHISRVGGTAITGNIVLSVYHCLYRLLADQTAVEVTSFKEGRPTVILDGFNYTKDGETLLPTMMRHIDGTNDAAALSVPGDSWKDLSRYFVVSHPVTNSFKAHIVYANAESTQVQSGKATRCTGMDVRHPETGELMYRTPFYAFESDDPNFEPAQGMCGGLLVADGGGDKSAIVGVISAMVNDARKLVCCLPLNKTSLEKLDFGYAIPASEPDSLPIATETLSRHTHRFWSLQRNDIEQMYGCVEFKGFVSSAVTYPKTRVQNYPWKRDVLKALPELSHDFVPPKFGLSVVNGEHVSPGKHAIQDLSAVCQHYSGVFHNAAVSRMIRDQEQYAALYDFYTLLDYKGDSSVAFSGVPGSKVYQGIKRTTAAGFPFKGPKSDYLNFNEDETVSLKPEILKMLNERIEKYQRGERSYVLTRGIYKDEPRSKDKVAIRKIRLFNPPDLISLLVEHLFLSPLAQISVLARKYNHTLGGMNVYSSEWGELRTSLESRFSCVVPGDFSKFDKSTSFQCMYSGYVVDLAGIQRGIWYKSLSPVEQGKFCTAFMTLAADISSTLVIVDGEILAPGHGNGSGSADTYKKNCDTHTLVAYECLLVIVDRVSAEGIQSECLSQTPNELKIEAFQLAVRLKDLDVHSRLDAILNEVVIIKHGDDGLYAVSEDYVKLFNFGSFHVGYRHMNMKFTPPDKGDGMFYYRSWDDVDIGKRKFVYNEELNRWLAPLDLSSIGKMLTLGIVKCETPEEKMISGLQDALREASHHGREFYDEFVRKMTFQCFAHSLNFTFRTWEEVVHATSKETCYIVEGNEEYDSEDLQKILSDSPDE